MTKTVAIYKRPSTLWQNARFDKKSNHFVEMVCDVVDFDEPDEITAKYGWKQSEVYRNGIRVHKVYQIRCKSVNGIWSLIGSFDDDKTAANNLIKQILNHPYYKGWRREA